MSSISQFFKPGTTVLLAGFGGTATVGELLTCYADGSLQVVPDLLAAGTLFGGDIDKGGPNFPGIVTADGYDSCYIFPGDEIIGVGKFPNQISYVQVKRQHDEDGINLLFLLKCDRERFNLHNRRGRNINPGRDFKRLLNIDQDVRAIIKSLRVHPDSYTEKLTFPKTKIA